MKLESKIGKVEEKAEKVYNFLSDFEKIKSFIPQDKINNWSSGVDWCSFEVSPVGKTGLKIVEKDPFKLLKYSSVDESQYSFTFWAQFKQISENDTRIKLTIDLSINPMLQMMVKKPLQEFLDKLVEQLSTLKY